MAVSYTRVNWKNRIVQRPRTYTETTNLDGSRTDTPAPGTVQQEGTALNETNLNKMDKGIKDCADEINSMETTIGGIQSTQTSHGNRITATENGIVRCNTDNSTQDAQILALTNAHNALADDEEALETNYNAHEANHNNPHSVTKGQVGLGNVPNVSTNNQTPTYTAAGSNQNLSSGEKLSVAFGKLARAVSQLYTHIGSSSNPHSVTKAQVGLGNVPNVETNNQTPTYTAAGSNQNLTSGETLGTAFGKIARAISQLWTHLTNTTDAHTVTFTAATSDKQMTSGDSLGTAFGKLARAVSRLYSHIGDKANPHETDLFKAAAQNFTTGWGMPDEIGSYTGNGGNQSVIDVNGVNCNGQQIALSFTPSKVAIMSTDGEMRIGGTETDFNILGTPPTYTLEDLISGQKLGGVVTFGPNKNYYHSGCGATYYTSAPEEVLRRNHGGAVVYGSSFIVQHNSSYGNLNLNKAGVVYLYVAWR